MKKLIVALIGLCAWSCSHDLIAATSEKTQIAEKAADFMARNQAPGLAIAVINQGHASSYFFGVADKNRNQRVSKETVFEIGSVTKVFTGTLLGMAIAKMQLKPSQTVNDFLPHPLKDSNFPITKITFKQLATHTSSLPLNPSNFVAGSPYPIAKEIEFLQSWQPKMLPGTDYHYSNLGYGVLGLCLSNLYHQAFPYLLKQQIVTPLNMQQTGISVSMRQNYAQGYRQDGTPAPRWAMTSWRASAGALRSTSEDMLKFLKANLLLGKINSQLKDGIKTAQHEYFIKPNGHEVGLGWEMAILDSGDEIYAKSGGTSGFTAYLSFIPAKQSGIVVMTNVAKAPVKRLANAILIQLLKKSSNKLSFSNKWVALSGVYNSFLR